MRLQARELLQRDRSLHGHADRPVELLHVRKEVRGVRHLRRWYLRVPVESTEPVYDRVRGSHEGPEELRRVRDGVQERSDVRGRIVLMRLGSPHLQRNVHRSEDRPGELRGLRQVVRCMGRMRSQHVRLRDRLHPLRGDLHEDGHGREELRRVWHFVRVDDTRGLHTVVLVRLLFFHLRRE